MNKQTIIIVTLSLIILAGAGVYAYNYTENKGYKLGFQDATLLINQQIINSLYEDGYINIFVPIQQNNENQTYQVKLTINESKRVE